MKILSIIKKVSLFILLSVIAVFALTGCTDNNSELQGQYEQLQQDYEVAQLKLAWLEKYNSIQNDMTKQQVADILGNSQSNVSSSSEVHTMEAHRYNTDSFYAEKKEITVYYRDNKVILKIYGSEDIIGSAFSSFDGTVIFPQ